MMEK
jgi:hypothetical protein